MLSPISRAESLHWAICAAGLSSIRVIRLIKHGWVFKGLYCRSTVKQPIQWRIITVSSHGILSACFCRTAGLSSPPPPALGRQPLRVWDCAHQRFCSRSHHGCWWVSREKKKNALCIYVFPDCVIFASPDIYSGFSKLFFFYSLMNPVWSAISESCKSAERLKWMNWNNGQFPTPKMNVPYFCKTTISVFLCLWSKV